VMMEARKPSLMSLSHFGILMDLYGTDGACRELARQALAIA